MDLSGAGGPQAPPFDAVDLKVEEILGEKNETIGGISRVEANDGMLK